jgi:hypothetical protein
MKDSRLFGDMTPGEIESFEKRSNSIVLFDEETGINFQKSREDGDEALIILIDNVERPVVIFGSQIDTLKSWINNNFN